MRKHDLNEFSPLPKAISHKQLNSLLSDAQKEPRRADRQGNIFSNRQEYFEDLLVNWSVLSQQLLDELNKQNDYIAKGREPQSLMALEAHLQMAIQAHKASDL